MGCTVRDLPAGSRVIDRLDIYGAEKVDEDDVADRIATAETKRALFGILEGTPILTVFDAMTVEYNTYDKLVLDRDMERIRRFYRARGFYDAEVRAARVIETKGDNVRIELHIREGRPVIVEDVRLDFDKFLVEFGATTKMADLVDDYENAEPEDGEDGPRFDEDKYDALKAGLLKAMTDRGFAYATVEGEVAVDIAARTALVELKARAGPKCKFGVIKFDGLGEIPERPLRAALGFEQGDQFSTEKIDNAQYALADYQVFGSVQTVIERSAEGVEPVTDVPITINVQPIKLRAVKGGIGAEVGSRVETHVLGGWESRNFLGGLRKLNVRSRGRLGVLSSARRIRFRIHRITCGRCSKPASSSTSGNRLFPRRAPTRSSASGPSITVRARCPIPTRSCPAAISSSATTSLRARSVSTAKFRFNFWGGNSIFAAQFIKLQFGSPFSYTIDEIPPGFTEIIIPYLDTTANWDFRRNKVGRLDPVSTHKGAFFGVNLQFAGGFLGGSADDIRVRARAALLHPVSRSRGGCGFVGPRVTCFRATTEPRFRATAAPTRANAHAIWSFSAFAVSIRADRIATVATAFARSALTRFSISCRRALPTRCSRPAASGCGSCRRSCASTSPTNS